MTHAKLWLRVYLAGFLLIVSLLIVTLFTAIPYGDLSRVALLSDRAFGWRIDQPVVAPETLRGVTIDQADILVVGDSFSMSYNWQSELVKANYRVATIYWGSLGDVLCTDFNDRIREAGFRGRLIIVESVEYLLQARMDHSARCARIKHPMQAAVKPLWKMPQQTPGFALNWEAKLLTGWRTYRNMRRVEAGEVRDGLRLVHVLDVPNGCAQFSSLLCERIPFLSADIENGPLSARTVAQMQDFQKVRDVAPMLWMVIPNKSTVYLNPDFSRDFVTAFNAARLGPDLFTFANEERTRIKDFYQPNDTHLSIRGLLTLGPIMLEAVRARIGSPAGPST